MTRTCRWSRYQSVSIALRYPINDRWQTFMGSVRDESSENDNPARRSERTTDAIPKMRLARLFAGEAAVMMDTEARGAFNTKAKSDLGWTLRYPSWRQGFPAAYA